MQATLQMSVLVPNTTVFLAQGQITFPKTPSRARHVAHLTSTIDWRKSWISVCCLCAASSDAVGPYGINAASEYADDTSDR